MSDLLGGRCLDLTLTGNETVDEVMRLTGLRREPAAEILAFAKRLAAKAAVSDLREGADPARDGGAA